MTGGSFLPSAVQRRPSACLWRGCCCLRARVIAALLLSTALVALFGQCQAELQQLSLVAALAGFCTNAAVVGLYALFVQYFPAEVRAGGTGFVIGVGRGGAVLGPVLAGFLFEAGQPLSEVAVIMGLGSLVAAIAILFLTGKDFEHALA